MEVGRKMVDIIKDPTGCPQCFQTAEGIDSIKSRFGLRKMADGVTRVQSWCKDCRKRKERVGKW